MIRLNNLLLGHRLLATVALVLCMAGVLTGVAIVHGRAQEQAAEELVAHALPAVRLAHLVMQLVDDARGLEALHVLLRSASERRAIEQQVQALRRRVASRLASYESSSADAIERGHLRSVANALAAYWAAQDRLFVASRRAADDAAADSARQLLAGPSQQAWQDLSQHLHAWWTYTEQRAAQRARQGQQAASQVGLLALLLLLAFGASGLSMAAVLAGRWRPQQRRRADWAQLADPAETTPIAAAAAPHATAPQTAPGLALSDIAAAIDRLAPQASTLAFGVAAAAGRAGAPARELALVASELRNLSQHAAGAARALRQHLRGGPSQPATAPGSARPPTAAALREPVA